MYSPAQNRAVARHFHLLERRRYYAIDGREKGMYLRPPAAAPSFSASRSFLSATYIASERERERVREKAAIDEKSKGHFPPATDKGNRGGTARSARRGKPSR